MPVSHFAVPCLPLCPYPILHYHARIPLCPYPFMPVSYFALPVLQADTRAFYVSYVHLNVLCARAILTFEINTCMYY